MSSEKQTESESPAEVAASGEPEDSTPERSSSEDSTEAAPEGSPEPSNDKATESQAPVQPALVAALVAGTFLALGWVLILHVNRWHFTPSVFFLFAGWTAILLTAKFLWEAAWSVANEPPDDDEDFWRPVGERAELEAEKRALVKAIKEIEFDHQMGKMSDRDADELTRYYRLRAIEVIKALEHAGPDQGEAEGELPVARLIERDVEARLQLARKNRGGAKKGKKSAAREARS